MGFPGSWVWRGSHRLQLMVDVERGPGCPLILTWACIPAAGPVLQRPTSEGPGERQAQGALPPTGSMTAPGLPPEGLEKEDMVMGTAQRGATAVVTSVPRGALMTPVLLCSLPMALSNSWTPQRLRGQQWP